MCHKNIDRPSLRNGKYFSGKDVLYLLLVVVLFVVFFYSIFFRGHIFGFRDDGYFYTPLFKHVQDYWDRGELPLWDPCDNMGQPLAAMPTSAVFYPGKIVFFLPHILPLDYFDCFNIYIMMHVACCFIAVYYLLSRWRCSKAARMIGALSYTFSGPVLFQYCNIVFLVGAAWLPFVIAFADRFLRTRTTGSLVGIAVSLAMMVLGGDPELAYVSALPTLGLVFLYWRNGYLDQRGDKSTLNEVECVQMSCEGAENRARPRWRTLFHACFLIGLSAVFAGLLAAIQILPSASLTKVSDRYDSQRPTSLWRIPGYLAHVNKDQTDDSPQVLDEATETGEDDEVYKAPSAEVSPYKEILCGLLCCNLRNDSHLWVVYQFSVSPWSVLQLFWSDFGGKMFPGNSYWFCGLPNDRAWSPTLYMGIISIVLALGVFRLWGRKKVRNVRRCSLHQTIRRWASWSALIALCAALGGYCGFWTVRALMNLFGADLSLQFNSCDPVGGPYWLMCVLLPGFESFRYPAKVYVVGVLAFAVLAALGWDCVRRSRHIRTLMQFLIILTGAGLAGVYYKGADMFYIGYVPTGNFFGPYEPELAWNVTIQCFLRTEIVLVICYLFLFIRPFRNLLRRLLRSSKFSCVKVITCAIVLLVSVDLLTANRSIVSTVPKNIYRVRQIYVETIRKLHQEHYPDVLAPPRFFHATDWVPADFFGTVSDRRFAERFYWENATLAPKMHLLHDLNSLVSPGTLYYRSYAPFASYFGSAIFNADLTDVSAFVDTPYWLLSSQADVPGPLKVTPNTEKIQRIYSTRDTTVEDFAALRLPVDSSFWFLKEKTSRLKIFHNCTELDNPHSNIVNFVKEKKGKENPLPGEYVRFVSYQAQRIEFEVNLTAPGDIMLAEQYDKDWYATVRPVDELEHSQATPLEIKPCLGFMRRITLPAGSCRVVMEYKPVGFYRGAMISLVAWLAVVIFGITMVVRRRRFHTANVL